MWRRSPNIDATFTTLFSLEFLSRGIRAIVKNTSPTTLTRNYRQIQYMIRPEILATNLCFPLLHGRMRYTGGKRRTGSLHDAGIATISVRPECLTRSSSTPYLMSRSTLPPLISVILLATFWNGGQSIIHTTNSN